MNTEKYFTIFEAWQDFEENVVQKIPRPLPPEITNARYSALQKPRYPALGIERLQRLLETYAPGRYSFEKRICLRK